jgi:hypothetical protein
MVNDPITPRSLGDKDAPHMSPVTPAEDIRTVLINNISWGAVLAGVTVALVAQLLLNLLGFGVGAATLDPATGDNPPPKIFTLTAAIWWTFSGLIAAFLGGLTAGRLSGRPKENTTAWHGLIAWGLTTLIVFFLVTTTLGSVVGGAFRTLGGAVAGVGRTAVEAAAPSIAGSADPFGGIERQLRETTTGKDPAALRDASISSMRALVTGDPADASAARERAAQALARAQDINIDEARKRVTDYEAQYQKAAEEAKQKAKEVADAAAKAAATGAIVAFFALLFGAMAGWIGGRAGAVEPTVTPGAGVR